MERPIVGISMGDPFGNGPEITVKALSDASLYERCRPIVVGDGFVLVGFKEAEWEARLAAST